MEEFYFATSNGDIDRVTELLDKHGNGIINTSLYGNLPLHVAAFLGHLDIAVILLERGGNECCYRQDDQGFYPLHRAAWGQHVEVAKEILQRGGDDSCLLRDNSGMYPLHWAAKVGSTEIVKLLLQKGGKIACNGCDNGDRLPLHLAAMEGHTDILELILNVGGDELCKKRDNLGRLPLHWAAGGGFTDAVKLLIRRGGESSCRVQDSHGQLPLHRAASGWNPDLSKFLVICGGVQTANIPDKSHHLPVHFVRDDESFSFLCDKTSTIKDNMVIQECLLLSSSDQYNFVKKLLHFLKMSFGREHDPWFFNITHVDSSERSLLHVLIESHLDLVEDFLGIFNKIQADDLAQNFRIRDSGNRTPLELALMRNKLNLVVMLQEYGADPWVLDNSNKAPMHYFLADYEWYKHDGHLCERFMMHCHLKPPADVLFDLNPICSLRAKAITKAQIKALLFVKDGDNFTLNNSFNHDKIPNVLNQSVLHALILTSAHSVGVQMSILDCLLDSDIDVNLKDCNGRSAIHLACLYKQVEVVSRLVGHPRIDLDASDKSGRKTSDYIRMSLANQAWDDRITFVYSTIDDRVIGELQSLVTRNSTALRPDVSSDTAWDTLEFSVQNKLSKEATQAQREVLYDAKKFDTLVIHPDYIFSKRLCIMNERQISFNFRDNLNDQFKRKYEDFGNTANIPVRPSNLHSVIENIARTIQRANDCSLHISGSAHEGTKIGASDEKDYMVVFRNIEVKIRDVRNDGHISTYGDKNQLDDIYRELAQSMLKAIGLIFQERTGDVKCGTGHVHLEEACRSKLVLCEIDHSDVKKDNLVKIDLVPMLNVPVEKISEKVMNDLPLPVQRMCRGKVTIDEFCARAKANGVEHSSKNTCHCGNIASEMGLLENAITPRNNSKYETGYQRTYDEIMAQKGCLIMLAKQRLSNSYLEAVWLKCLPRHIRFSYAYVKWLRTHPEDRMDVWILHSHRITSYVLKNILLNLVDPQHEHDIKKFSDIGYDIPGHLPQPRDGEGGVIPKSVEYENVFALHWVNLLMESTVKFIKQNVDLPDIAYFGPTHAFKKSALYNILPTRSNYINVRIPEDLIQFKDIFSQLNWDFAHSDSPIRRTQESVSWTS